MIIKKPEIGNFLISVFAFDEKNFPIEEKYREGEGKIKIGRLYARIFEFDKFSLVFIRFVQGYGENWYSDTEYFEGEWYADKRSGWGRMYYEDGSVYEGEWYDDNRSGQGMMRLGKRRNF